MLSNVLIGPEKRLFVAPFERFGMASAMKGFQSSLRTEKEAKERGDTTMLHLLLMIVLVMLLLGALPTWPHSRNWGYAPSGSIGVIAAIVLLLLLLG